MSTPPLQQYCARCGTAWCSTPTCTICNTSDGTACAVCGQLHLTDPYEAANNALKVEIAALNAKLAATEVERDAALARVKRLEDAGRGLYELRVMRDDESSGDFVGRLAKAIYAMGAALEDKP